MTVLPVLDLISLGAALGLLGVLFVLLARDAKPTLAARLGLLVIVSLIAILIWLGAGLRSGPPMIQVPLRLLASGNTLFVWWLGLALFDDEFRLGRWHRAAAAAWLAVIVPTALSQAGTPVPLPDFWPWLAPALSLVMLCHVIWITLTGRGTDLVEQRRRMRWPFMLGLVSVIIIIVLAEGFDDQEGVARLISIFRNVATVGLTGWALIWLGRIDADPLFFNPTALSPVPKPIKAADRLTRDAVLQFMHTQRPWAEAGLTISALSVRLDLPEHRLRQIINGLLGYRNFAAFLSEYRLAEVKRGLADPARARLPILTLAMDAGFASLAPFNRAFRAREAMTPSEWRESALSRMASRADV